MEGGYTTRAVLAHGRPDALVIHCSAHDFRPVAREFIEEGLRIRNYDLLAVPGGVQVLTLGHYIPKFAALLRRWVEFLVKNHKLPRVVVLGHEDCAWYRDFRFGPVHIDLRERQVKDLKEVGEELRRLLGVQVQVYFAAKEEEGRMVFAEIV
jgi:hypothetical protein